MRSRSIFDSLSASNAEENLNLAFEVGERDLGIPRLLDAKHLSDATQRPDEKSVMTCLSYFWKCFASMKSTEMASRRVGKLVKVERANHEVRTAFEAGARRLREYMERRSAELHAVETRRTEEDVVEHAKANAAYKKNVRKAEFAQKADLESSVSYLNAKLRADRRAPYTPPPGLAMRELNAALLEAVHSELEGRGLRHAFVLFHGLRGAHASGEFGWQEPLLNEFLGERGIPYVSSKGPLRQRTHELKTSLEALFQDNGHYTAETNRAVFLALESVLRECVH